MDRHAWIRQIKVGDVLQEGAGRLRVVRRVSHTKDKTSVVFSILHCSWTGRCYTVLTMSDLKTRKFRPTGRRVELRKSIDRKIKQAIEGHERPGQFTLTCCDVEGLA